MRTVYVASGDVRDTLRLKDLIGRERVARFRVGEHPLGLGFTALEKQVIGLSALTESEALALGRLHLLSKAIFTYEWDWREHASRLAGDLSDAHECLSIEFELQVIAFALGRAQAAFWTRHEHATPDIRCVNPDLLVECKLLRVEELTRDTLFDAIAAGGRQHRAVTNLPIAIAVGFDRILSKEARASVNAECQNRGPWFRQRPEVAAALVFLPKEVGNPRTETLAVPALWLNRAEVNEIINHRATLPLPVGFSSAN